MVRRCSYEGQSQGDVYTPPERDDLERGHPHVMVGRHHGVELPPEGAAEDRIRYEFSEAPVGEYRVVMTIGDKMFERSVSILKDEWWQERR